MVISVLFAFDLLHSMQNISLGLCNKSFYAFSLQKQCKMSKSLLFSAIEMHINLMLVNDLGIQSMDFLIQVEIQ